MRVLGCLQSPRIVAKISYCSCCRLYTGVQCERGSTGWLHLGQINSLKQPLTYRLSGIEYFGTALLMVLT